MPEFSKSTYEVSTSAAKWLLDALVGALPSALIHSLIFLVISVAVIVICQKLGAYTRLPRAWNLLTKLHYLALVATFMLLGFGFGLIASLQKAGNRVIDTKLHPVLTAMVLPVKEKMLESLPPELAARPMSGEEMYNSLSGKLGFGQGLEEGEETEGLVAEIGRQVESQLRAFVIRKLIDQAITKAAENAGIDSQKASFSLEVFKSIDFSKKADEIASKVTDAAKQQVGGFAWSLRLQLLLYWAVVMALMAIDPLIYYLGWLPKQRERIAKEVVEDSVSSP